MSTVARSPQVPDGSQLVLLDSGESATRVQQLVDRPGSLLAAANHTDVCTRLGRTGLAPYLSAPGAVVVELLAGSGAHAVAPLGRDSG